MEEIRIDKPDPRFEGCDCCKYELENPHGNHCRICLHNDGRFENFNPKEIATPDNVNHPIHYQGKNECIDVMIAMFGIEAVKAFCKCNAYKYRFRANMKNGQEDIEKAEWYESKLIQLEGDYHE